MFRRLYLLTLSVLMLTLLVGCASSSSGNPKPVDVTITAGDYYFKSSLTSFQQGVPYHFVVTNEGSIAHEFMTLKPMPTSGNTEEIESQTITLIEEDELGPGQTASVDYTFDKAYPAGTLEFACHLAGHYEQGMQLSIEVK